MRKYYYNNGKENLGPYTIIELQDLPVHKETLIWYEGMPNWVQAKEIHELNEILSPSPPPVFPPEVTSPPINDRDFVQEKKKMHWITKLCYTIGLSLLAFLLISIGISMSKDSSSPSYEEKILTVAQIEAHNPLRFLSTGGSFKETFLGDKIKISGVIKNNATVTTYKDVVLEITYYSKTKTPLRTVHHTVYEFIPHSSNFEFTHKIANYSEVGGVGWNVVSAKVK